MQVHYHSTISNSPNKITFTGDKSVSFFITMTQNQWTKVIISGIIVVLSVNVWAANRDMKGLNNYNQIHFSN